MPSYLECQAAILRENPEVDIASANALNLGGGPLHGRPIKPVSPRVTPLSLLDIIQRDDALCVMSSFRRSVVDRIGGFNPLVPNNEDYEFWLRAAYAGCRIVFNAQPQVWYRRRKESKSANEDAMMAGVIDVLQSVREWCAGRQDELAAIDKQIERFTRQRLANQTKAALLRFALQA